MLKKSSKTTGFLSDNCIDVLFPRIPFRICLKDTFINLILSSFIRIQISHRQCCRATELRTTSVLTKVPLFWRKLSFISASSVSGLKFRSAPRQAIRLNIAGASKMFVAKYPTHPAGFLSGRTLWWSGAYKSQSFCCFRGPAEVVCSAGRCRF